MKTKLRNTSDVSSRDVELLVSAHKSECFFYCENYYKSDAFSAQFEFEFLTLVRVRVSHRSLSLSFSHEFEFEFLT